MATFRRLKISKRLPTWRALPGTEPLDTPLCSVLRKLVTLGLVLLFGLMLYWMFSSSGSGNSAFILLGLARLFLLGFFAVILVTNIRPGTGHFWKVVLHILFIIYVPMLAVSETSGIAVATLFTVYFAALVWRLRKAFREETFGWRLSVVAGLLLAVAWVWFRCRMAMTGP